MPVFAAPPDAVPAHITTVVRADVKTGRLVRSVVVQPRAVEAKRSLPPDEIAWPAPHPPAPQPEEGTIFNLIDRIASEQGVEVPLVHSVIQTESNYNPGAVSPKGALGLMQLIPATARRFGVSDAFNARENIEGGVRYLRFLLDYYGGDYVRTIAAYNAGEAAVDKYNGIPPYSETLNYVYAVARNLKAARSREAAKPAPAPQPEEIRPTVLSYTGADGRIYYRTP